MKCGPPLEQLEHLRDTFMQLWKANPKGIILYCDFLLNLLERLVLVEQQQDGKCTENERAKSEGDISHRSGRVSFKLTYN